MIWEQFTYFREILTGVQNDSTAKIIRGVCLLVLAGGTAWAVMNYMDASQISDMSVELNIPSRALTSNPQELDRVLSLAQNVNNMRKDGERLAAQMDVMNKKLFTADSLMIPGFETDEEEPEIAEAPPEIRVTAVTVQGNVGYAVVSVGENRLYQGLIVRKGYDLPEKAGRVINIRKDGITVRQGDEDVDYGVRSMGGEVNYMIR